MTLRPLQLALRPLQLALRTLQLVLRFLQLVLRPHQREVPAGGICEPTSRVLGSVWGAGWQMGGQTGGRSNGNSSHSTGPCPLFGPLPKSHGYTCNLDLFMKVNTTNALLSNFFWLSKLFFVKSFD